MDDVIDDIIGLQSNYNIQGFIDAVQMPNTVSESNARTSRELVFPHLRLQLPLYPSNKTSKFHC